MGNGDKITHAKFQVSILKFCRREYFLKKLIVLRKDPQKKFERFDVKNIREK